MSGLKDWVDAGMGVVALMVLAYVSIELAKLKKQQKNSGSEGSPAEVVVNALNRNSEAVSQLTQLLKMQFEFERERHAEDRARSEKILSTVEAVKDYLITYNSQVTTIAEKVMSEIRLQIGKLRGDLKTGGD
jgi:hypothetical protein